MDETRKTKVSKTNIDQSKKKDHNYKKKIEGHLWIFTYITCISRRKKKKNWGKSHQYRTTMNCTSCTSTSIALSLDGLDDMVLGPFLLL